MYAPLFLRRFLQITNGQVTLDIIKTIISRSEKEANKDTDYENSADLPLFLIIGVSALNQDSVAHINSKGEIK
jgi:hypothetical protein